MYRQTVKHTASRTASTPREVENAPEGMPALSSGREDEESEDKQQRVEEGHASHGGAWAKAWRKEGTCLGTRALIWFSMERVSRRDEVGTGDCSEWS